VTRRLHTIPPNFRVETVLRPLRRFVIGVDRRSRDKDVGYVLSHPKLGEFLCDEYFDDYRIEQSRQAFANWGRDVAHQLNDGTLAPEKAPTYLLQYLWQHFESVDAPATDFVGLTEEGWLRAWEAYEGGYQGFSGDVRRAEAALAQRRVEGQPIRAWRVRCQLILSSIGSIGSQIPGRLLKECVQQGQLPPRQALYWAKYKTEWERSEAIRSLAPHFPEALLTEALDVARKIDDYRARAGALGALGPRLPETDRASVLDEALAAAREIGNDASRAQVLGALAPHLPEALLGVALGSAREIDDYQARAEAVVALGARLPETDRPSVLAEALEVARKIDGDASRAQVLGALAHHLPKADQTALLNELLSTLREISHDGPRGEVLRILAPNLPESLVGEALEAALDIRDHASRTRALEPLATSVGR
jgi:hypothetical protein